MATARELAAAANANIEIDPERSILLALAAVEQRRSDDESVLPEAEEALHRAVTASRIELRVPGVGGRLDWSPDGTVFVTEGPEGSGVVDIRDARTGESVRSFPGTKATSPTSRSTTTARSSPPPAPTGRPASGTRPPGRSCTPSGARLRRCLGVWGPSFSRDGSLFASAWPEDGVVKVVDLATGRLVREVRSVAMPNDTTFDPAGDGSPSRR